MNEYCKVCLNPGIRLAGKVNAFKINDPKDPYPFGQSVRSLAYYECPLCGFLGSSDWDNQKQEFWEGEIYNDEYRQRVDPDWASNRSTQISPLVIKLLNVLFGTKAISILDYGAGNGVLGEELKTEGYDQCYSYDPYRPEHKLHRQQFDAILAVEVFEHSTSPLSLISDLESLLSPTGLIVFTTKTFKRPKVDCSYVAPRNGHLSIFTPTALKILRGKKKLYYKRFLFGLLHIYSRHPLRFRKRICIINVLAKVKAKHHAKRLIAKFT